MPIDTTIPRVVRDADCCLFCRYIIRDWRIEAQEDSEDACACACVDGLHTLYSVCELFTKKEYDDYEC
jgi:hypothetical protein